MRTDTPTLIAAMRILSRDIVSDDGAASAAIAEASDRLEELVEAYVKKSAGYANQIAALQGKVAVLKAENNALRKRNRRLDISDQTNRFALQRREQYIDHVDDCIRAGSIPSEFHVWMAIRQSNENQP